MKRKYKKVIKVEEVMDDVYKDVITAFSKLSNRLQGAEFEQLERVSVLPAPPPCTDEEEFTASEKIYNLERRLKRYKKLILKLQWYCACFISMLLLIFASFIFNIIAIFLTCNVVISIVCFILFLLYVVERDFSQE